MVTTPITLLIPESPEERQLLGRIYQDYGRQLLEPTDIATAPASAASGELDVSYTGDAGEQSLRRFLTEVHGENARRALWAIADETLKGVTPPDSDKIRERLGMDIGPGAANRLGGMLTSVGFAMRRTGFPRPYMERWGSDRQTYVMEGAVAQLIQRLLDVDGSLR